MISLILGIDSEKFNIMEYYFGKMGTTNIPWLTFSEFIITLVICYIIRFIVLFKIEKNSYDKKTSKEKKKQSYFYLLHRMVIELIAGIIIGYLLIVVTGADPRNVIANILIAPITGFILSILLDLKFIVPIEEKHIGNINKSDDKKSAKNKTEENKNNSINININSDKQLQELNDSNKQKIKLVDKSILDSDDFNSEIVKIINEVKGDQIMIDDKLTEYSKQLKSVTDDILKLTKSEIVNKKIVLKSMMYKCLNKKYATPEENDKIVSYFQIYRDLVDGKDDVIVLYEDYYSKKVSIHEESAQPIYPELNEDMETIDAIECPGYQIRSTEPLYTEQHGQQSAFLNIHPDMRDAIEQLCTYGQYDSK